MRCLVNVRFTPSVKSVPAVCEYTYTKLVTLVEKPACVPRSSLIVCFFPNSMLLLGVSPRPSMCAPEGGVSPRPSMCAPEGAVYFSLTLDIVYAQKSKPVQCSHSSCSLAKSIYNYVCVCAPK